MRTKEIKIKRERRRLITQRKAREYHGYLYAFFGGFGHSLETVRLKCKF